MKSEENLCLGTKYDSHTTHHHAAQFHTEPEALRCEMGGGFNGSPLSVCERELKKPPVIQQLGVSLGPSD